VSPSGGSRFLPCTRETEVVLQDDVAPAAWLAPRLVPESFEVRRSVPQGFEAYARIFFPSTARPSRSTASPAWSASPDRAERPPSRMP
jgi:hypothetical protein